MELSDKETVTRPPHAPQSMLAPISPLLAGLFSSLSCPHLRQVSLPDLLSPQPHPSPALDCSSGRHGSPASSCRALPGLQVCTAPTAVSNNHLPRGSVGLAKARLEEVQEVAAMMGIDFPGGCSQQNMEGPPDPLDSAYPDPGVVDSLPSGPGPVTRAPGHGQSASGYGQPAAGATAALGYVTPALQEQGASPSLASAPRRPGGSVGSKGSSSAKGETRPGSRNGSGDPGSRNRSGDPGSRSGSGDPGSRSGSGGPGSRNGSVGPGGRKRSAAASPGGGGVAKSGRVAVSEQR